MADQTRKKARGKQPISRHPLFPAIVGLWTGALLGLCALALSPPFGASARILVALGAFAIGCLLGLMMARRFANPALAAKAANEQVAVQKRGELWSELESLTAGATADSAKTPQPATEEDALASVEEAVIDKPAPLMTQAWEEHSAPAAEPLVPVASKPVKPVPATMPPLGSAAARIAGAELSELSHVELLERLALSMQRRGRPSAVMSILQEEAESTALGQEESAPDDGHRSPRAPDRSVTSIAGRQSSADTEKALRDALAALQRMSGAA